MKKIKIAQFLFLVLPVFLYAEYPPHGWTDSIIVGVEQATRENKSLLLYFGGTDWCSWCHKLEKEVFDTAEFRKWSRDNLVVVLLDYPRDLKLPEHTVKQNQIMQQFFGVKGFPTLFLLDSKLFPLLQTGYRRGGAAKYIEHLKNDKTINADTVKGFPEAFRDLIDKNING